MFKSLFMSVATICAMPVDREADEEKIATIKSEVWPSLYRNQDVEGLGEFLAPSFVNLGPDGSAESREQSLAWVASHEWNPENFTYSIERFDWFSDDLVLVSGKGRSDRTDETGEPCRHEYFSSNLLRRAPETDLGWQALNSHVSGIGCEPEDQDP